MRKPPAPYIPTLLFPQCSALPCSFSSIPKPAHWAAVTTAPYSHSRACSASTSGFYSHPRLNWTLPKHSLCSLSKQGLSFRHWCAWCPLLPTVTSRHYLSTILHNNWTLKAKVWFFSVYQSAAILISALSEPVKHNVKNKTSYRWKGFLSKPINKSTAPEEAVKPTQPRLRKANPKLKIKRTEKV